jgi:hypothetical protein
METVPVNIVSGTVRDVDVVRDDEDRAVDLGVDADLICDGLWGVSPCRQVALLW